MVQKGGEVKPRTRKVHPPLSSSDVGGGLFVMAIASISHTPKELTLFKVNFASLLCLILWPDSHGGAFMRHGPGGPTLGRLSMDRVKTGVVGLDTMLNGGLLPARPYVVSGPTGSGKTILALHFLLEGLRQQEPCLLVTLDEPPIEVKANMGTFGWNLDRLKILDATPDIRAHKRQRSVIDVGTSLDVRDMEDVTEIRQSSQIRALEVTVHSVQKMIKQEFSHHLERTKQRYKRVVIDSMTALKMFAMQGQDSRILIQSFVRFLAELEATTLIISERLNKKILETEFFLARGEVRLHKWIDGSVIRRAGSAPAPDLAPAATAPGDPLTAAGKIRTGIPGLDKMLHGGYVPGRPYIVSGPPGAGKTILAMQFLREGLEGGERCLFVALEEPPNELKINMRGFRWNLDDLDVLDANSDIRRFEPTPILEISTEEEPIKVRALGDRIRKTPDFESKEVTVHSLQQLLKTLLLKRNYERVVIDSITALKYFCMREFEEAVTTQSFMRYLAESKVTSLLTLELPEEGEVPPEAFLARGEIRLHKLRDETG